MVTKITIIGVGRLGLCNALILESKGFDVLGVDVSYEYVSLLNRRDFVSPEPFVTKYLVGSESFKCTTDLDEGLRFSDVIFIFVDTTTKGGNGYDHSKLSGILSEINKRRVNNKYIVIGCTVTPGYIQRIGRHLLRDSVGCTLNYNPEFIAQGNIISGLLNPDFVLIGEDSKEAGNVIESIYREVLDEKVPICRMSTESAEICKISLNCFITMKIAYANMIGDICDNTKGAKKEDVLSTIGLDKRVGSKCLKPGWGFGGPCFPRDNRALGDYSKSININPILPSAIDETNKQHADIQTISLLNVDIDRYIFEDVTYKEGCPVPIIEESQKLRVARLLVLEGKEVLIRDRKDVISEVEKEYGSLFKYDVV